MSRAFCLAIAVAGLAACENGLPTDPACDDEYFLSMFENNGHAGTSWTLAVGDSVMLTAVATSGSPGVTAEGCQLYLFSSNTRPAEFSWTSTNTAAVTVASGVVRAVAPGMTHVRATHGNQLADVVVSVQSSPP